MVTKNPNVERLINVDEWLKKNEENFKPPILDIMMSTGFLKIMFVGGPNTRKDYHLNQGEEFFYQLKGDMCLKAMEKGEPKDIHIKEGEVFVIPSRIPHSAQRCGDSLGLVIERERAHQWEGVRYYCEDNKTILWHKYFHLRSLAEDYCPVIDEFFASEQYKTGVPIPGTTDEDEEKFKVDKETTTEKPFPLKEWVSSNIAEIKNGGKLLFGNGEFKIHVHGHGTSNICNEYETWLWMMNGAASYVTNGRSSEILQEDSIVIPPKQSMTVDVKDEMGYFLSITMDPNATPQK